MRSRWRADLSCIVMVFRGMNLFDGHDVVSPIVVYFVGPNYSRVWPGVEEHYNPIR